MLNKSIRRKEAYTVRYLKTAPKTLTKRINRWQNEYEKMINVITYQGNTH